MIIFLGYKVSRSQYILNESMTQVEINIPAKSAAKPRVLQTANTLPDAYVGARKLLRNSPWMATMGLGFILSFALIIPAISVWYYHLLGKGVVWSEELAKTPEYLETFRWSLMSSLFAFAYFMILTGLTLAPITTKYSRNTFIKQSGQIMGTLRYPLAFFLGSLVTLSVYLNSGINVEVKLPSTDDANPSSADTPIMAGVVHTYISSIVEIIMRHSDNFKFIPYLLVLLSFSLLLEKILILYISHAFHQNFYTKRIKTNNLVLSCFETLSARFPPSNLKRIKSGVVIKTEHESLYAQSIFDGLLKEGRDSLLLEDFMEEIEHPEAVELFAFLDFNKSGDISITEFKEATHEAYEEKRVLLKSLKANEKVIDRIDSFFVTVIILFKVSLLLPKLGTDAFSILGFMGGSAVLIKLAFNHVLVQLFDSVMHFMVTHPYDVGDKVQLGHETYRIRDMGFWKTTLINSGGQISYIPNYTMFGKKFGNYRRSDKMESDLEMVISIKTTKEEIEMYMAAVNEFILNNGRYFDEKIVIKNVNIPNSDVIIICFGITHKFNFNNDDNFNFRCELIFKNMISIAKEQNLTYMALRFQDE